MKNSNVTESNLLSNEVDIQLDVLSASMMNGVGGEVDNRNVVTEDNNSLVNWTRELGEKLTKPGVLDDDVGHGAILSLSARARDSGLSLRRPRNKRRAKVDAISRGRTPSVRATRPVRVGVCHDIRGWRGGDRRTCLTALQWASRGACM